MVMAYLHIYEYVNDISVSSCYLPLLMVFLLFFPSIAAYLLRLCCIVNFECDWFAFFIYFLYACMSCEYFTIIKCCRGKVLNWHEHKSPLTFFSHIFYSGDFAFSGGREEMHEISILFCMCWQKIRIAMFIFKSNMRKSFIFNVQLNKSAFCGNGKLFSSFLE